MDQQVRTTLTRADTIQTKQGQIFKLWDQYGTEFATFQQPVWEHARQFQGQPVVVTYTEQPAKNPNFPPNKYLQAVALDNGAQAPQAPAPQGLTVIAQAPDPEPDLPPAAQPSLPPAMQFPVQTTASTQSIPLAQQEYQRPKHPNEQAAIRKAVALQCAVAALPNLETEVKPALVLAIAEMWERWLAGEKIAAPQSEIL